MTGKNEDEHHLNIGSVKSNHNIPHYKVYKKNKREIKN